MLGHFQNYVYNFKHLVAKMCHSFKWKNYDDCFSLILDKLCVPGQDNRLME